MRRAVRNNGQRGKSLHRPVPLAESLRVQVALVGSKPWGRCWWTWLWVKMLPALTDRAMPQVSQSL